MALVKVVNVTKVYRVGRVETHALRGVSFELQPGEFTALAGPSGSGKTTLLNLIGGLDAPTQGEIEVAGEKLHTLSANDLADFRLKTLGFVFQTYNLIEVLTALENVEFPLLLQRVPARERRQRAQEALAQVGLAEYLHRKPQELSGGQQQRVAVARALVTRPRLVLADEPTANLDSQTGLHLIRLMEQLNRDLGITFLFSTHDPKVLEAARRVIRLRDGHVVEDTGPESSPLGGTPGA